MALVLPTFAAGPTFDDFHANATQLAGPGARDCGLLRLREVNNRVLRCAKEAISQKEQFVVVVQRPGVDSEIFSAIVRTKAGDLWNIDWDSDPSGGLKVGSAIHKRRCSGIEFSTLAGNDYLVCTPT